FPVDPVQDLEAVDEAAAAPAALDGQSVEHDHELVAGVVVARRLCPELCRVTLRVVTLRHDVRLLQQRRQCRGGVVVGCLCEAGRGEGTKYRDEKKSFESFHVGPPSACEKRTRLMSLAGAGLG